MRTLVVSACMEYYGCFVQGPTMRVLLVTSRRPTVAVSRRSGPRQVPAGRGRTDRCRTLRPYKTAVSSEPPPVPVVSCRPDQRLRNGGRLRQHLGPSAASAATDLARQPAPAVEPPRVAVCRGPCARRRRLRTRTADAVHVEFARCAAACKANMATGATPTCIVDHWVLHVMESERYRRRVMHDKDAERPTNLIREFADDEMADTLFAFLFASQDASSSATTWLFQILAQRPDVLDRVRRENLAARGGDASKHLDLPMLESLTYTAAVIKELLRHRPPVIFVPYLATRNFPIAPDYTVPRGSLVIPSRYPALHDPAVYPEPDVFDPDRWITGDAESKTKNWLVFGAGPHECLARKYVPLSMAAMIGKAALELDWTHHATERSEEIRVFASLFPMVCAYP